MRYRPSSPIKYYNIDNELNGHIVSYGIIGSGKSVSTLSILQGYLDNKKYKIWDLYGGERNEGLFWTIPNKDKLYWEKLKVLGTLDEEGPKQYKVNLLYPYFESKLPKNLPIKLPDVNSKLFTIPLKDVEIDDIRMILGNPAETNKYIWEEILNFIKKTDTCGVLGDLSKKFKGESTILHKNFIVPMMREKFLMNSGCDYNLDLEKEAENQDVVSVLCLDFIPEKYHLFIINYIIRKLNDLVDVDKIPKKNILNMREVAMFFRATEDSVLEDKYKLFRTNMSHYMRMARRGAYFALDCQSPAEVKGLVGGSESYLMMFCTTAWRDKQEMCEELKRERRMNSNQIADLAMLNPGEAYIAERGQLVKKVKISLPRTIYWKKEHPDFYKSLWDSNGGKWHNTEEISLYINDLINKDKGKYKEEIKKMKKETLEEDDEEIDEIKSPSQIIPNNIPRRKLIPIPF